MKPRVLVVDDQKEMLELCRETLVGAGLEVAVETSAQGAAALFEEGAFDALVADIKMPGATGIDLLKSVRKSSPNFPVILMTAYPDLDNALEAIQGGVQDFLIKPFHPDHLRFRVREALKNSRLKSENRLLARHLEKSFREAEIIGDSPALRRAKEAAAKIAAVPSDALIFGESGTGKQLFARRIHADSGRTGRFVPIDCGAIPQALLESELFGSVPGGGPGEFPGLLEFADKGTLYLSEITELPRALQAKLLRTLQDRQLRRVGGGSLVEVDIRVLASSKRDVAKEIAEGRFREELYFRLNVVNFRIPPLRERREDIPVLIGHFLPRLAGEFQREGLSISDEAVDLLGNYSWPGNVLQLQNILKRAIVECRGDRILPEHIPEFVVEGTDEKPLGDTSFAALKKKNQESFESEYFSSLLRRTRGSVKEALEASGLPMSNFYWYLKKHAIKPGSFRE